MFILNGLSRADGEKLSGGLAKVKSEADALRTETDALNENKLEQKLVDDLLSSSKTYDFDDGKPLFSVPAINGAEKGTSSVVEDENGCYQAVEVGTGTIGSTSNVYSQFKLGSITENASKITLEFDFEYEHNGRMKLAIADLDVINSLSNSDIRWNTKGIAADIFSNSNNNFQINGKDALRASFFGTWLHAKFVMDFSERKVQYTITSKTNPADTLEGNVDFRDTDCAKITGIAVYTWLQNDKLYIDNINITALYDARENTRYIVGTGGVYKEYTYVDGVPVLVGRSDAVSPDGVKALVTDKADKQTVSGGFVAGRDADVLKVDGTPLEYYYVGQYKGGERTTYVSGNPKALFDKDNTGSSVDSAAQIFNVFDLGKPVDISAVTLYVSDAGADGANMVCLENELSVGAVRHDVLRTDGKPQSSVPVIENKLDTDGYIKTGYTDGRYIGTYRYIMVYNWSSHCTASEIYVETDVKETPINAIQLGTGTNTKKKTLQVYDYMLLDEDGTIPSERLKTTNGGFSGGDASFSGNDTSGVVIGHYATNGGAGGAAVGSEANVTGNGAAVGYHASAKGGGAIGASATADNGFAGGMNASAGYGCAAGRNAVTKNGVAVGNDAKTQDSKGRAIDAIQLGAGTNSTEKTLQVYDYTLMNADGTIPAERLSAYSTKPQQIGTWIDGRPIYRQVFQGVFEEIDIEDISQYGGKDGSGLSFYGGLDLAKAEIILYLSTVYHITVNNPSVIDDIYPVRCGSYSTDVIVPTTTSAELATKLTAGVSGYTTIIEYVGKE